MSLAQLKRVDDCVRQRVFPKRDNATGRHFCRLKSPTVYGIHEEKEREHLSYFERFIRRTASNFCREAENRRRVVRTWKSREHAVFIPDALERKQSMSFPRLETYRGKRIVVTLSAQRVRRSVCVKPSSCWNRKCQVSHGRTAVCSGRWMWIS